MDPSLPANLVEYSPSSTTVKFAPPIPLLRGPVPAASSDDPPFGPYVLAFRNPQSWATAYKCCESKIIEQCEGGAKIGCAISASEKCKPPWWRNLIGGKLHDLKEREKCEEHEMEGCLVAAKEKCVGFAREKCWPLFREARIAVGQGVMMEKVGKKLICLASAPESRKKINLIGFEKSEINITNRRACEFLASDPKYEWLFKQK